MSELVLSGRFRFYDWHNHVSLKSVLGEANEATQLQEDDLAKLALSRLAAVGVPREAWIAADWTAMRLFDHDVPLSSILISGFLQSDFEPPLPLAGLLDVPVYLLAKAGGDVGAVYQGRSELLCERARESIRAGYQVSPEHLRDWGLEARGFSDEVCKIIYASMRPPNHQLTFGGGRSWRRLRTLTHVSSRSQGRSWSKASKR